MNNQLLMSFPRLELKQNRIQSGSQARCPMFNSTELQILNKQHDLTQTDMKGTGLKKLVNNHHIARQTKNTVIKNTL